MWEFHLEKTTNHDDWKNKLREHLKRDRIKGMLSVFLARLQGIENFYWQLVTERDLESSAGVQLDGIGDIVGEVRGDRTDNAYRTFLRGIILANLSHGKTNSIYKCIDVFIDAFDLEIVGYSEEKPAALRVELLDFGLNYWDYLIDVFSVLCRAIPAGVRFLYQFERYDDSTTFQCSTTYGSTGTYDYNKGAGSDKYALGGKVTGAILRE